VTIERVRVGDVLRLDRRPIEPDPATEYISVGIRSFGKGIFHYRPTLGAQLGKLRFFELIPDRLVLSNIKAWEGAIALSTDGDAGCIASNRFLTYMPVDGRIDVRWAKWYFLSDPGIALIQQASPGSADRNRTLGIARFELLKIPLPGIDEQRRAAEYLNRLDAAAMQLRERVQRTSALLSALIPAALNETFAPFS
jgi:type I restriction enzyme S subunit